jgi:hypothetical protein
MTEALSLAALTATALGEGVRFLYAQAGELLDRRRERADTGTGMGTGMGMDSGPEGEPTPSVVASPAVLPAADPELVRQLAAELRTLRADLRPQASGSRPLDEQSVRAAEALRRVLEVIHGARLVFRGEPRDAAVVRGTLDADEVAGYVAGVRAQRAAGTVAGIVRIGRVEAGGTGVGVDLGTDGGEE